MKKAKKRKILYFFNQSAKDSADQIAEGVAMGAILRNADAYYDGERLESCDCIAGNPPKAYLEKFPVYRSEDKEGGETVGGTTSGSLSVEEIRAQLTELGVEFDPAAGKKALRELLESKQVDPAPAAN